MLKLFNKKFFFFNPAIIGDAQLDHDKCISQFFPENFSRGPSLRCFNMTSISKSSGDKTPVNKSA